MSIKISFGSGKGQKVSADRLWKCPLHDTNEALEETSPTKGRARLNFNVIELQRNFQDSDPSWG